MAQQMRDVVADEARTVAPMVGSISLGDLAAPEIPDGKGAVITVAPGKR